MVTLRHTAADKADWCHVVLDCRLEVKTVVYRWDCQSVSYLNNSNVQTCKCALELFSYGIRELPQQKKTWMCLKTKLNAICGIPVSSSCQPGTNFVSGTVTKSPRSPGTNIVSGTVTKPHRSPCLTLSVEQWQNRLGLCVSLYPVGRWQNRLDLSAWRLQRNSIITI